MPCYEQGAFTLASGPDSNRCVIHGSLLDDERPNPLGYGIRHTAGPRRCPRGRAARAPAHGGGPTSGPGRVRRPRTQERATARAMARGLQRARHRLRRGDWAPHPGWRHFIETGWRVLTDQAEALALVAELVDAEEWRADKRRAWTAILRQLVCAMDWDTGLVTAVTADRLGAAGDRAPRTVSRVMAWAREAGLVVVVEHAASAEFLGTDDGRTPTYALVTSRPQPAPQTAETHCPEDESAQLRSLVDESGDLPKSLVKNKPLNGRRLEPPNTSPQRWPLFRIPEHGPERTEATRRVLHRLGLQPGGRQPVPLWRARALLCWWWAAGGSPAGLLWALDHHPDRPEHHRGDAFRGARDPLRVLGHRLAPWRGRLRELPAAVTGIRGDYRSRPALPPHPMDRRAARDAAPRAAFATHLDELRERRRSLRS